MNKRQRKKAHKKKWKQLGEMRWTQTIAPISISLSELEASKMDQEELYKMMRKKWEDAYKRLYIATEDLYLNDGSNKYDLE
jgi:hypothetical protein